MRSRALSVAVVASLVCGCTTNYVVNLRDLHRAQAELAEKGAFPVGIPAEDPDGRPTFIDARKIRLATGTDADELAVVPVRDSTKALLGAGIPTLLLGGALLGVGLYLVEDVARCDTYYCPEERQIVLGTLVTALGVLAIGGGITMVTIGLVKGPEMDAPSPGYPSSVRTRGATLQLHGRF